MSDILLPISGLRGDRHVESLSVPTKVRTVCPFCGLGCIFSLNEYEASAKIGFATAVSDCAGCDGRPRFVFEYGRSNQHRFAGRPVSARMFPAPKLSYEPPHLPNDVPEQLRAAFEDTVRAFNAQIYGATATSGRRTLEGIYKFMVAEKDRGKSLYDLTGIAQEQFDFKAPMRRLSDAIRNGGNMGAHFDLERTPDAEMAREIVALLHYLIEYLYVLPAQIGELEDRLSADVNDH